MTAETKAVIYTMELTIDSLIRARNALASENSSEYYKAIRNGEIQGFNICISNMIDTLDYIKRRMITNDNPSTHHGRDLP